MKVRLDVLMVERGLAESREKAQRMIRAGLVHTSGELLDKPGRTFDPAIPLTVKGAECPYVSRGGLKLAGALDTFGVDPAGAVALDIGASTGGFTDCLLQRGAVRVFAIDVGRGQLHNRLLNDPRVTSRERTHLDELQPADFPALPTLAVADLSFISLRRAFPVLKRVLAPGGQAVLLVKPQFEVGKDNLPRGGVVTDRAQQDAVLRKLADEAATQGFEVRGHCESPILGGDGNLEFFLWVVLPRSSHQEARSSKQ